MLRPLAIQSLLDTLTSTDADGLADMAMLTLVESGQIYASSIASVTTTTTGAPSPVCPRPQFRALMCPVEAPRYIQDNAAQAGRDEQKATAVSALASQAWLDLNGRRNRKGSLSGNGRGRKKRSDENEGDSSIPIKRASAFSMINEVSGCALGFRHSLPSSQCFL